MHLYKQQLWLHEDRKILPCPSVMWHSTDRQVDLGKDVGRMILDGPQPLSHDGDFSVCCRNNAGVSVIKQGGHHKTLKNLFQSSGIPPWLRDSIPLCMLNGELVAMGDWCLDERLESWMRTTDSRLSWQPENPLLKMLQSQLNPDMVDPAGAVR